ncbi:hypothetical protein [Microbulbifer epialgicus]|uniref:MotA/TolQ/ExbB proton channel family protein n=1 Tax=Microbulbifer epialgicus TaxID=393907 RepID=A0ABV4P8U9_9GAMM
MIIEKPSCIQLLVFSITDPFVILIVISITLLLFICYIPFNSLYLLVKRLGSLTKSKDSESNALFDEIINSIKGGTTTNDALEKLKLDHKIFEQKKSTFLQAGRRSISKDRSNPLYQLLAGVLLVQIVLGLIIYRIFAPDNHGTFGDMFGVVNTLFSGLALAGIIYTLILQTKELEHQRESSRNSALELKGISINSEINLRIIGVLFYG